MATSKRGGQIAAPALRHSAQIEARLRRIAQRVRDVQLMYEDGAPCLEILDQLSAARTALDAVALLVIEDHVTTCFEPAPGLDLDETRATRLLTAIARAATR